MIEVSLSPSRVPAGDPADLKICLANVGTGACTNVIFSIRLPTGIMRLSGRDKIEIGRLVPGQSVVMPLSVRANGPGRYQLTSANFSYRDHRGQSHRKVGFTVEITVDPQRDPLPEPQVTLELQTAELPHDEWSNLHARINNVGAVGVSDLEISVSGRVITDQRATRIRIEQLPGMHSAEVSFFVCAPQVGVHVPVHLDLAYSSQSGRHRTAASHTVRVIRGEVMPHRSEPEYQTVNITINGGVQVAENVDNSDSSQHIHNSGQIGAVIGGKASAIGGNYQGRGTQSIQILDQVDMAQLADELQRLAAELGERAGTPEQRTALYQVEMASIAARHGDKTSVWEHLTRAGRWALGIAAQVGTGVAAAVIAAALA
jgi:hypothetical protein